MIWLSIIQYPLWKLYNTLYIISHRTLALIIQEQKRAQTFKIGYSKFQKIKEFKVLILFYVN